MLEGNSYFDESLIKGVIINGVCAHASPEELVFSVVIQIDMLVYVYYNDVAVSNAIENNMHEQQCNIDLARTPKYNALLIYIVASYVYKPSGMWAMHTSYKFFDYSLTVFGCGSRGLHFPHQNLA